MKNITTLGIDLAKNTFSLVGMDDRGIICLKKTLTRKKLLPFVAQLPACFIAMEACSGAHYWAKEFKSLGHTVGILAAKFVEPFRKGGKNDINDAEAICEAARHPSIHFVPVKTSDQQAILTIHRIRKGLIGERTDQINQLRGLLSEFGIVMPQGRYPAQNTIPLILEDAEYDQEIRNSIKQDENAKRLETIPGVGELTASAIAASVPDPRLFKNARQFAAWLGLVPRQCTTG